MGLNTMSIMDNPTSLSVTGGTAQAFTADGQSVNNGLHVAANAVTDFRIRPHISFRNVSPKKQANGKFTLGRTTRTITDPYLDATTGEVHYVTTTIEQSYAVVIPAAQVKNNRLKAAQLLFDADVEDFNTVGSLA